MKLQKDVKDFLKKMLEAARGEKRLPTKESQSLNTNKMGEIWIRLVTIYQHLYPASNFVQWFCEMLPFERTG